MAENFHIIILLKIILIAQFIISSQDSYQISIVTITLIKSFSNISLMNLDFFF